MTIYRDDQLTCSACYAPGRSWDRELCDDCEAQSYAPTKESAMRTDELEPGMTVRKSPTKYKPAGDWFTVGAVRSEAGSLWVLDSDGYGRNFWMPSDEWEVGARKSAGSFANNVRALVRL